MDGELQRVLAGSARFRGRHAVWLLLLALSLLLPAGAAQAQCSGPPGSGDWTNVNRSGEPYWINIDLISCPDTPQEGDPPVSPKYGVKVWVRQSSGSLFERPRAEAQIRGETVIARVPTGGYVDVMTMRVIESNGKTMLDVDIFHESLDSKPNARSHHVFERGHIPPPAVSPRVEPRLESRVERDIPVVGLGRRPTTFYGMGDWDGDGHLDLLARNTPGDLMLYPGESRRAYSQTQPVKIGNGWGELTFYGMGDWDGDGHLDLVGRSAAGDLMLYPGEGQRAYSQAQPVKIGNGWGELTFYGMGDWDGDGHLDLVGRNAAGDLMLYPGESRRGYSQTQPVQIGNGWGALTFYGMGDWDGDGHLDLIGRNAAGDLMLYPGESQRGYSQAQPVKIGNGWGELAFYGMGDWDSDGHLDLVGRTGSGDLMLYPGESRRGYSQAQPVKIGNGW